MYKLINVETEKVEAEFGTMNELMDYVHDKLVKRIPAGRSYYYKFQMLFGNNLKDKTFGNLERVTYIVRDEEDKSPWATKAKIWNYVQKYFQRRLAEKEVTESKRKLRMIDYPEGCHFRYGPVNKFDMEDTEAPKVKRTAQKNNQWYYKPYRVGNFRRMFGCEDDHDILKDSRGYIDGRFDLANERNIWRGNSGKNWKLSKRCRRQWEKNITCSTFDECKCTCDGVI